MLINFSTPQHRLLHTFDSDLDDVVCNAQVVCGRTAVVACISFIHIRNLQCFLEVMEGHPAAWQFTSILSPGDLRSGPITEAIANQFCPCLSLTFGKHKPLKLDKLIQNTPDANLQALSDAFQLQSVPSQNHLGAGGTQRQHETGATLPLWAV